MRQKFLTDLYVLADDVLKNFYLQRHGYKSNFYFGFNNNLRFAGSDGSDEEQAKLLQQLADNDMFEIHKETVPRDMPLDFISSNAQRNPKGIIFYLSLNPDGFNHYMPILKKSVERELALRIGLYLEDLTTQNGVELEKVGVSLDYGEDNNLILKTESGLYNLHSFNVGARGALFRYLLKEKPNEEISKQQLLKSNIGYGNLGRLRDYVERVLQDPAMRKAFVPICKDTALMFTPTCTVARDTVERWENSFDLLA